MQVEIRHPDPASKRFLECYFSNPKRREEDAANALRRFKEALVQFPLAESEIIRGDYKALISSLQEENQLLSKVLENVSTKVQHANTHQREFEELDGQRPLRPNPGYSEELGFRQGLSHEATQAAVNSVAVFKSVYGPRQDAIGTLSKHLADYECLQGARLQKQEDLNKRYDQLIRRFRLLHLVVEALKAKRPYLIFEGHIQELSLFTSKNDLDPGKFHRFLSRESRN